MTNEDALKLKIGVDYVEQARAPHGGARIAGLVQRAELREFFVMVTYKTTDGIRTESAQALRKCRELPIVVEARQTNIPHRMDLHDPRALLHMAAILKDGAEEYGVDNWRDISVESHINHALVHLLRFLALDKQEDHLGHAACRVEFALGVFLAGEDQRR